MTAGKTASIAILFFVLIYSGCGRSRSEEPLHLRGIAGSDHFYSNNSFITADTVTKTVKVNNLDFWLFSLGNSSEKESLRQTIRSLMKKINKKKVFYFLGIPLLHDGFYPENSSEKQSFFLQNIGNENSSDINNFKPLYRELGSNILFNTVTVRYDGTIEDHFDDYLDLLDRGFKPAVAASAEILGPDWRINNQVRMGLICNKNSREDVLQALRNRRTYVSFDTSASINFNLFNGTIGDTINPLYKTIHYEIEIDSPEQAVGTIEILTNNKIPVMLHQNVGNHSVRLEGTVYCPNDSAWYLVRVQLENGSIVYTTPIWVERTRSLLIRGIGQKTLKPVKKKNVIEYEFTVENVADKNIYDIACNVVSDTGMVIENRYFDLKKRESRTFSNRYMFDSSADETLLIKCFKNSINSEITLLLNKKRTFKRIMFDAAHYNIFSNNFSNVMAALRKEGYIVDLSSRSDFRPEYDDLKKYDLMVITTPDRVLELISENFKFYYAIHLYVYHGGSVILAAYNSEQTQESTTFLNELLRVVYSPLRYRMDAKSNTFPLYDDEKNHAANRYMPLFTTFKNSKIVPMEIDSRIYMRNPIEIYGHRGGNDFAIKKLYWVKPLFMLNETTGIEVRSERKPENLAGAAVHKFGKGKVAVLSGINFSDYDLDALDNEKWFVGLVNYLVE